MDRNLKIIIVTCVWAVISFVIFTITYPNDWSVDKLPAIIFNGNGETMRGSIHLGLIFNVFLAAIAFLLSEALWLARKSPKILYIPLALIWLLWFPNTFYMITDLLHISVIGFDDPSVGSRNPIVWLALANIVMGCVMGVLFGLMSLEKFKKTYQDRHGKLWLIYLPIIGLLTGFGIYLGRIQRLNSFDFPVHSDVIWAEVSEALVDPLALYFAIGTAAVMFLLWQLWSGESIKFGSRNNK